MVNQTLDELKAENAAKEAKLNAQTDENAEVETEIEQAPQASDVETGTKAADDEAPETEADADPGKGDGEKAEVEDWMKGDDHTSQAEKEFTNGDMAGLRKKLQAKSDTKLAEKDSELERLKADIDALKRGIVKPEALQRPKRDEFFDHDDPDAAYDEAFANYVIGTTQAKQDAKTQTAQQETAQAQAQLKVEQGEDAHYERVKKLVKDGRIKPENYQAADLAFRQAIESVAPGEGDAVAAIFMGRLGEGSDKVIYNVGINAEKRAMFAQLLREDPSGLDAGMYLAGLKSKLTLPKKQTTKAPEPAPTLKGDAKDSGKFRSLKKAYKSASNDQERVDIVSKAREAGIGISETITW